jgi:hypothetical protein
MPSTPRRRKCGPAGPPQINFARHARLCYICHHPDRDEIEQAFIDWVPNNEIRYEFQLEHRDSIYRHARAAGLFERRRRNVGLALEHMIEKAGNLEVTPESVIHAIHALSRLDDTGRWNEVVRRVVVAKHAVFSHESRASMTAPADRRLRANATGGEISSQGEIASQEVTPDEREQSPRPALPPSEEARDAGDAGDPARAALFAKVEELSEKVDALCAQANSKEEAAQSGSTETPAPVSRPSLIATRRNRNRRNVNKTNDGAKV